MKKTWIQQACEAVAAQAGGRAANALSNALIISASDGVARAKVQTLWLEDWRAQALSSAVAGVLENMALNAESLPRITQGKWLVQPEGD
ncbi:hypothetical protein HPC38_08705 [Pasteurellaceae bacterium HPA106]|uniref:hypothetical protein n=1 Tax=Spirabiliibacterium pneumoniae TaxID=221400 RepID=UPI001AAC5EF7|nr:hypothetical protein [Spirabiliibacterium pneumoniae]MBE2896950.1 hypothetical protein [Spirabiliibacterium pneumoniae]